MGDNESREPTRSGEGSDGPEAQAESVAASAIATAIFQRPVSMLTLIARPPTGVGRALVTHT
ncbi:MAG TPA: hypothetical protein VFJ49_06690 [Methyloceanibacter sp.]|nr:hypothetical protein [Methyloceanibacter sp.]